MISYLQRWQEPHRTGADSEIEKVGLEYFTTPTFVRTHPLKRTPPLGVIPTSKKVRLRSNTSASEFIHGIKEQEQVFS